MKVSLGHCLFLSFILHGLIVCGLGTGSVYARASIELSNDVTGTIVAFASLAASSQPESSEPDLPPVQAPEIQKTEEPAPQLDILALESKPLARLSMSRLEKPNKNIKRVKTLSPNKKTLTQNNSAPQTSDPLAQTDASAISSHSGGMGSGDSLKPRVVSAPKPPYPPRALRMGFEGKVTLDVAIAADGRVTRADISESSGRTDCDNSAVNTALAYWRFSPATLNGRPIESREKVVVVYEINR